MALIEKYKLIRYLEEMENMAAKQLLDTPQFYENGTPNQEYIRIAERARQRREFAVMIESFPEEGQAEELKPCPFCGSEARLIFEDRKFFVECDGCGTRGGWASATTEERSTSGTRALAAATWAQELWNRRAEEGKEKRNES